jgi:asparagine synthase (glutamine-hydrolysing)
LFGGYGRYRRAMRDEWLGGRSMRHSGTLEGLGLLRNETFDWRKPYDSPTFNFPHSYTRLQKAQAHDCADWLPNDLLNKLDRCLMAHGVEGRVPFLDSKVADFAFGLPDGLKIKNNRGKWLLRKWLNQNLPEAKAFSKKRGFSVPVVEWISAKASILAPLVANQPGVAEACHGDKVKTLFTSLGSSNDKKCGQAAWHLLYYALWHNHHICRFSLGGDVFDSLNISKGSC